MIPKGRSLRVLLAVGIALWVLLAVVLARRFQWPSVAGRAFDTRGETYGSIHRPAPIASDGGFDGKPVDDEPLNFQQFMELVGEAAAEPDVAPLAKRFRQDFMNDASLRGTYEDYRRRHALGQNVSATKFLADLRQSPAFQKLMSIMGAQSGAGSAAVTIGSYEGLGDLLSAELRAAHRAAPAEGALTAAGVGQFEGAKAMNQAVLAKEWVGKGAAGGAVGSAGGEARLVRLGGGGESSRGAHAGGGGRQAVGGEAKGSGAGASGGAARNPSGHATSAPNSPPAQQGDGHAVTPLGVLSAAPTEIMDRAIADWLVRNGLDPNAYGSQSGGIWDLCFARGELRNCHLACENPPQTTSTLVSRACRKPSGQYPYWSACRQVPHSDEDCLLLCRQQSPPCVLDPEVVDRLCEAPKRIRPIPQPPHPNCPGGGGAPAAPVQCKLIDKITERVAWTGPNGEGGTLPNGAGQCQAGTVPWTMPDGRKSCYVPGACPAWTCQGNIDGLREYRQCVQAGGLP